MTTALPVPTGPRKGPFSAPGIPFNLTIPRSDTVAPNIMSTVVFIAGVLCFQRYFLAKTMVPMIVTTLMCLVLGWDRLYSRVDGLILFGSFFAYLLYLYVDERRHYDPVDHGFLETGDAPEHVPNGRGGAVQSAVVAVGALAVTVVSAMAALRLTEVIVHRTGLGGSLIGVVTLGVASALPELITAISGNADREQYHEPTGGNRRRGASLDLLGTWAPGLVGPTLGGGDRCYSLGLPVVQQGQAGQEGWDLSGHALRCLRHASCSLR